MQVTSKRHSMVVEFRPHAILTDKFVYTLKFKGETQSMRLMSRRDMIETVNVWICTVTLLPTSSLKINNTLCCC